MIKFSLKHMMEGKRPETDYSYHGLKDMPKIINLQYVRLTQK